MEVKEAAKILECAIDASVEEIKRAFKAKALKYHPDRPGGSEEAFVQLNQAYEALSKGGKESKEREGITKDIFVRFRTMYEQSPEEKEEIVSLYKKYKGNLSKVIDSMILGEDEQESRYRSILSPLIEEGALPSFPLYKKSPLTNKKRQKKRREEAEKAKDLEKELLKNAENRKNRWSSLIDRLETQCQEEQTRPKKRTKRPIP